MALPSLANLNGGGCVCASEILVNASPVRLFASGAQMSGFTQEACMVSQLT